MSLKGKYFRFNASYNHYHGSIVQCIKDRPPNREGYLKFKIIEKHLIYGGKPTPSRDLIPDNCRFKRDVILCIDNGTEAWDLYQMIPICSQCFKEDCPGFVSSSEYAASTK